MFIKQLMVAALLLAFAATVILYFLIGYPLLLRFVSWQSAVVHKDFNFRPSVSVLLAVHNGEAFIRPKIESLLALDYPANLLQIIIISDGSTDDTDRIAESFASRVQLVKARKGGKAAALNLGLLHATGEILFLTDVRQLIDPPALSNLVSNFADQTVGAVSGELRVLRPDRTGEQADMELYWRYELWARAIHSSIHSMFSATGCIYAIRRSLAAPLPVDTLSDDVALPLGAFFRGYRIILDSSALAFDYPVPQGGEFRRRMRTLAGVWQVYARRPALLTSANPMRFHFFSHRFGRLLLPWAIVIFIAATIALQMSPLRRLLGAAGAIALLLAVVDAFLPENFALRRIASPARTFIVMNLAALLSILVFVVKPEKLWRPTRIGVRD